MYSSRRLAPTIALLIIVLAATPFAATGGFTLNTNSSPQYAGLVTPSNSTYQYGTQVTIWASPIRGWTLVNWTCTGKGCYNGTDTNANIYMLSNITETAHFGQIGQPTPLASVPVAILTRATISTTTVQPSSQQTGSGAYASNAGSGAASFYTILGVAIFVIIVCYVIYYHSRRHVSALKKQ